MPQASSIYFLSGPRKAPNFSCLQKAVKPKMSWTLVHLFDAEFEVDYKD